MSRFISFACLFPFLFVILGIYIILFSCIERIDVDRWTLLLGIGIVFLSLSFSIKACKELFFQIKNLYIPYIEKKYNVIEGEVKNLFLSEQYEEDYDGFEIDNLKFYYRGSSLFGPYCRKACNDGFIRNNGQHIKIYYISIEYNKIIENYIVGLFIDSKELIDMKGKVK